MIVKIYMDKVLDNQEYNEYHKNLLSIKFAMCIDFVIFVYRKNNNNENKY